ncbi:hypothetical protein LTR62_003895 [Meristemomyces frigidus]|uniref:ASTRA-associated protein 1 n=1 Tax=Meristemomyces frigidus TaxID=1508187 RepID=A0AAN7TJ32_9PEZI|nr:hypothetical protein LTR62_003895 [Meristemomyces frigidus]
MATLVNQAEQSATLPPAQPTYILRGHSAQIHAVHFFSTNRYLISGDADGWVIIWDMPIRRPVGVWRAHTGSILGIKSWPGLVDEEDVKIITHGRDNKVHVWQLTQDDISRLSTNFPADAEPADSRHPWLLHTLTVNALNFCSFATSPSPTSLNAPESNANDHPTIIIAVPGLQDGDINLTTLPHETRLATIVHPASIKTGMVMAIALHIDPTDQLRVVVGYESGYICLFAQRTGSKQWEAIYTHETHTQPTLSLDLAPGGLGYFYSSSADAIIGRHALLPGRRETKIAKTKHAGQQSLVVRSDEKVFATAGWDGRIRVYSTQSLKELAVLKWHKEGCYALAFAHVHSGEARAGVRDGEGPEGNRITGRTMTVAQQRERKTKETHWLAAGSKDGKISLWELY